MREVKLNQRKKFFSRRPFFIVAGVFLSGLIFWIFKFYPDNLFHLVGFLTFFSFFNLFFWRGVFKRWLNSLMLTIFLLLSLIFRILSIDTFLNIIFLAGFLLVIWRLLKGKTDT